MEQILAHPLTREAFKPFGDVIDTDKAENFPINNGMCQRYHDLTPIETSGVEARPLINIFRCKPYDLPIELKMVERHPLGSQAFMPLSQNSFVVIVAEDDNGIAVRPRAFFTEPGQGINFFQNTWHGVLTALEEECDFLVIDRGGEGVNLQEHYFEKSYLVLMP